MTRRNQRYYVEVEWSGSRPVRKTFKKNYQVSSMAVAANRGLREWRKSPELGSQRPIKVTVNIERLETTTRERGKGKRKKLHG